MSGESYESMNAAAAAVGLDAHGVHPREAVHWNLSMAALYEVAIARGEGRVAETGAFTAVTAPHTGRSPDDRFIVEEPDASDVDWGEVNRPISRAHFEALRDDVRAYLEGHELFVRDARAGSDPDHALSVRVVSESAWHTLFAHHMFLRPHPDELPGMVPGFTVLHAPFFQADPDRHGTRTGTAVVLSFGDKTVLVAGTAYAGEIKKSIFSALNHLLPAADILPMHCSANLGPEGDTALFFGLSGTGKTTLSADPERGLIGDDEHGWGAKGIFNFEGGCYAKTIRLSAEGEPEIFSATDRFGAILENVVLDPQTRRADFEDGSITENTRGSYPIHFIPNAVVPGVGGHPKNVVFLTADAFGVLPPIARLTPEQAMYHFLSGYTAKVAGTERGVTEPKATFSAGFGAPFLPRHPSVYAGLLGERLKEHGSRVWLVNTGWTGGAYGSGTRMKLSHTRAMLRAALAGELDGVDTELDAVFGVAVPVSVPGVPSEVLRPRSTWADGAAYDAAATKLAGMFWENFAKYAGAVSSEVREAGPNG
jgi:phosphoenolpyruvate carboxykinase (ATP)